MGIIMENSKSDRKELIKNIEKHLRNYNNYKAASVNLHKQLEFLSENKELKQLSAGHITLHMPKGGSLSLLQAELNQLQLVIESIDRSMMELTDTEQKFIEFRYFKKWSIEKSAMHLGYSDKALFVTRNQVMDKLILSLGSVTLM
ncbi:transcriptional regulator [Terribacillus saccharophilus]|uniref:transcriptional regulator n=1 Tax=Terribacillus saccharophilus TaxID=361277 RepID=UPI003D28A7B1